MKGCPMRVGSSEFRVRSVVVFFLLGVLLFFQTQSAWASPPGTAKQLSGRRMLFVWSNWFRDGDDIVSYPERRRALLDFCESKEIEIIFLNSEGVVYGDNTDIRNFRRFIREAHRRRMLVFGLQGNHWWAIPAGSRVGGQTNNSENGLQYVKRVVRLGMFDGIMDDTEPYLANTSGWWRDTPERAQWYLDWLNGVKRIINGRIPFWATIPFWYDQDARVANLTLEGSDVPRPLNRYVSDIVDVVNIMDYRDFSEGGDGLITHAQGEMLYKPAIIGVETQCLGTSRVADKQSFCEEGNAYMEGELSEVHQIYGDSPNFAGFSIHYYESYRDLPP